jgi:hypothetical protein
VTPESLLDNKVMMFAWALAAGIASFVAQQVAERLKSRAGARLDVLTSTLTQTLERLITSVQQVFATKSQELKALKSYGEKLIASGRSDRTASSDELTSLLESTTKIVYQPLPSNLFLPPEFSDFLEELEVAAAVAWVLIVAVHEDPATHQEQIGSSIVHIERCLNALRDATQCTRTELWDRLRRLWTDAKMPPILAPIPLHKAWDTLLSSK